MYFFNLKQTYLKAAKIMYHLSVAGVSIVLCLLSLFAFHSVSAQAQGIEVFDVLGVGCFFEGQTTAGGATCSAANSLLNRAINFLVSLAAPLAIFVIIWGGYQYMFGGVTGKGDGKNAIQAAVIGLVIVTLSQFAISTLFGNNGIISAGGVFNAAPAITFLRALIQVLVGLAGGIATLVIVWGGYKYFFSGLDFDKKSGAEAIRNGVVGLVIVLIANSLFDTVVTITNTASQNPSTSIIQVVANQIISPFVADITTILFNIATGVAVLVIMWGGYKYYFSGVGGKEDGLKNIQNGVIGLVAVFVSRGIVTVINQTLAVAGTPENPIGFNINPLVSFITLITSGLLLPISLASSVFFFVLGGFYWVSSSGDSKKIEKAQTAVKNALIGLVISLLAGTIIAFITFIFGFNTFSGA